MSWNYLDLFSGIGGFGLGAYWAGLEVENHYFSEVDPYAVKVYRQRFPDAIPLGDIREIDGKALADNSSERIESGGLSIRQGRSFQTEGNAERSGKRCSWILSGGFPCQDISVAGKGAGINGARSGLWFEYARLIGEIRPRYAIIENVGVLTRRGLDDVLGSLAEIGYDAEWSDIRASDIGAPHRRERIWIVAYPDSDGIWEQSGRRSGSGWTGSSEPVNDCADVAYPEQQGLEGLGTDAGEPAFSESRDGGAYVADPERSGRDTEGNADSRKEIVGRTPAGTERSGWWSAEPDVGRVAYGIPARVDQLKGLGNAIVPQIAEMIFRQILENSK